MESCTELIELDLYDNKIKKIEGLDSLAKLETLDLSFNRIKEVENLEPLVSLKKLFLISNRFRKIQNLGCLTTIEMVDFGDNKLESIEGIEEAQNTIEFYCAKNRIKEIHPCIGELKRLRVLGIQTNDIKNISGLEEVETLEELYMQQNFITKIEGLENNKKLKILDLAYNMVQQIDGLDNNKELTDLWLNKNCIKDWSSVEYLQCLPNIDTIYLIDCPVASDKKYVKWIIDNVPQVQQIDSDCVTLIKKKAQMTKSAIKPLDQRNLEEAQKVLKSVLKKTE